jgi:hypothetical protein
MSRLGCCRWCCHSYHLLRSSYNLQTSQVHGKRVNPFLPPSQFQQLLLLQDLDGDIYNRFPRIRRSELDQILLRNLQPLNIFHRLRNVSLQFLELLWWDPAAHNDGTRNLALGDRSLNIGAETTGGCDGGVAGEQYRELVLSGGQVVCDVDDCRVVSR